MVENMPASVRPFLVFLTLQEGGLIIEALAEYPFKVVFELIGKLNLQANACAPETQNDRIVHEFEFTAQELSLVIKALGDLPFNRVNMLLAGLHEQISRKKRHHPKKAENGHVRA